MNIAVRAKDGGRIIVVGPGEYITLEWDTDKIPGKTRLWYEDLYEFIGAQGGPLPESGEESPRE